MIRKRAFVIAGIGFLILIFGILAYFFITNPGALTERPIRQPATEEEREEDFPENGPVDLPLISYFPGVLSRLEESIGNCLVVNMDNCSKAIIPHSFDGAILPGIGFNIPGEEITLYSPIDGYVVYFGRESNPGTLMITKNAPYVPARTMDELNDPARNKSFIIGGYGIEPTVINDSFVKKGQPIAVMSSNQVIFPDKIKEVMNLIFLPEAEWDKDIRSEDPIEYVGQLMEIIKTQ
jgi:hypothetical protein